MTKVDNDPTKYVARPFVIVANVRTGGTFLSHCLSNHPDVYCDRAESVHHGSMWRKKAACLDAVQIIDLLTHMQGYRASGCKLTYRQTIVQHIWRYIENHNPHVIHLSRMNVLRQGISRAYNQHVRRAEIPFYPVHTFRDMPPPQPIKASPVRLLGSCRKIARDEKTIGKLLSNYKGRVLHVTYTDLVGSEGQTQRCVSDDTKARLCGFLGVKAFPLCCLLKRVHSHPLRAMFTNWNEIEAAVKDSEFAPFLADEKRWYKDGDKWRIL